MTEINKPYVVIRTKTAGCFAGIMVLREGQEVTLEDARRIWYWAGAASLSELATSGTVLPNKCKFPEPVKKILLTEVIEIIYTTEKAEKSIRGVPVWSAQWS